MARPDTLCRHAISATLVLVDDFKTRSEIDLTSHWPCPPSDPHQMHLPSTSCLTCVFQNSTAVRLATTSTHSATTSLITHTPQALRFLRSRTIPPLPLDAVALSLANGMFNTLRQTDRRTRHPLVSSLSGQAAPMSFGTKGDARKMEEDSIHYNICRHAVVKMQLESHQGSRAAGHIGGRETCQTEGRVGGHGDAWRVEKQPIKRNAKTFWHIVIALLWKIETERS